MRYGISIDVYDSLFNSQVGVCAICKESETIVRRGKVSDLAVDHDHATGTIRGLLCQRCNQGIGNFRNRVDLLASAINYLSPKVS